MHVDPQSGNKVTNENIWGEKRSSEQKKLILPASDRLRSGKSKQSALDRSKDPEILKHILDVAGAENRVEVATVGLMARRRYFVKQGNLLSPTPSLARALGDRNGFVSKELGFCSLSTLRVCIARFAEWNGCRRTCLHILLSSQISINDIHKLTLELPVRMTAFRFRIPKWLVS